MPQLSENIEIGGGKARLGLPQGQGYSANPSPSISPGEAKICVPQGQTSSASLGDICGQLMVAQRDRVFSIKMQSQCDRAAEAYIRLRLGYRTVDDDGNPAPEAERKRLSSLAVRIKAAIEHGKEIPVGAEEIAASVELIVRRNAVGRAAWDEFRTATEKSMIALARSLPVWTFVESVKGVGPLGLAIIVGEAGNLGDYPTKSHLWKRLGMAVIDGNRQGAPGKDATAKDWIRHGYNKKRRAQIWSILDDVMLRQQWQGGEAQGPYGAYYAKKKAEYLGREGWTAGRADKAARRYMAKMFLRDLLRAWKAAEGHISQGQY